LIKIDILGSCVSRDAFSIEKDKKFQLDNYFARSSIISMYSKPISVRMEDIQIASNFQKRMVYYDLTKEFQKYIKKSKSDFLIIDFIDERFHVLKTVDSYITRSREFLMSGLTIKKTFVQEEERHELWKQKIDLFVNDIKTYFDPKRVILHKAFWQSEYKGKDGHIHQLQEPDIEKNNSILTDYYDYLEEKLKGINVIHLTGYVSDENHKWGLSPFHYEDNYYIEFLKRLKLISNQ
jgi:hypothetical protein